MEVKTEKLNNNKNKSSKLAGSTEKYPQRCIAAFNCIKEKLKNTKKVTRYGIILSLMNKHKDDDIYKAVLFKLWRSPKPASWKTESKYISKQKNH